MASKLADHISDTYQALSNCLTNRPSLVRVVVEDEQDVPVWYRILTTCAPEKIYKIQPYSYDPTIHGKGKQQILSQNANFGKHFIGCVDSDYDWLLSAYTPEGRIIANNDYLFQTQAYSIENLALVPVDIAAYMVECVMQTNDVTISLDSDYAEFLKAISETAFEILLWQLTLKKELPAYDQLNNNWHFIFNNGDYNNVITDGSLTLQEKRCRVLEIFASKCCELKSKLEVEHGDLATNRDVLHHEMDTRKGLNRENAYLFMRGHDIYEFIIHTFFGPIEKYLRNEHERDIRANTTGIETNNAINHYKKVRREFGKGFISRGAFMVCPGVLPLAELCQAIRKIQ